MMGGELNVKSVNVWFLCLQAYQLIYLCKWHQCRRTVVVLINPWLGGEKDSFAKGISPKVNIMKFTPIFISANVK